MRLHPVIITIRNGKGEVVVADQVHDDALARRVVMTFPVIADVERSFFEREEYVIDEAKVVLAALLEAFEKR